MAASSGSTIWTLSTAIFFVAFLASSASSQAPSDSPSPSPSPAPAPAPAWVNITKVLVDAGEFGTLVDLLQKSGVGQSFQLQANDTSRGISIFAPSNAAFQSKRAAPLLANLSDTSLKALLEYHALNEWKSLSDLQHSDNNVTKTFATYNVGGQYEFNISFISGVVFIENEWNGAVQVTNTLYNTDPVSIFAIGQVLLPVDLFGPAPPPSPTPAPSPSETASTPPSNTFTSSSAATPPSSNPSAASALYAPSPLFSLLLPALILLFAISATAASA